MAHGGLLAVLFAGLLSSAGGKKSKRGGFRSYPEPTPEQIERNRQANERKAEVRTEADPMGPVHQAARVEAAAVGRHGMVYVLRLDGGFMRVGCTSKSVFSITAGKGELVAFAESVDMHRDKHWLASKLWGRQSGTFKPPMQFGCKYADRVIESLREVCGSEPVVVVQPPPPKSKSRK